MKVPSSVLPSERTEPEEEGILSTVHFLTAEKREQRSVKLDGDRIGLVEAVEAAAGCYNLDMDPFNALNIAMITSRANDCLRF